jgi:hypothetical protein
MEAVLEGKVWTYIDHHKLGSGYHQFFVFNKRGQMVRLLDPTTLQTASVPLRPKMNSKGITWGLRNPSTAWFLDYNPEKEAKALATRLKYMEGLSKKAEAEGRPPIPFSAEATRALVDALRNKDKT